MRIRTPDGILVYSCFLSSQRRIKIGAHREKGEETAIHAWLAETTNGAGIFLEILPVDYNRRAGLELSAQSYVRPQKPALSSSCQRPSSGWPAWRSHWNGPHGGVRRSVTGDGEMELLIGNCGSDESRFGDIPRNSSARRCTIVACKWMGSLKSRLTMTTNWGYISRRIACLEAEPDPRMMSNCMAAPLLRKHRC